jgi:hypothetical protein
VCRACSIARRCKSSPILMEEKGSETQGRHGDVGSEGSVEQRYEPTNRNWIRGGTVGRGRVRARSPYPSRASTVNPAVVYRKGIELTPGGLRCVLGSGVPRKLTERGASGADRTAEVSRGHSVCLAVCVSGGLKSRSARGHELISKGGSNVSLAKERGRYGEVYPGTKAKAGDSQDGPAATSCYSLEDRVSLVRGNLKGLRRTTGSYSKGAIPPRNRSAQAGEWSSLHYGGEGVVVPP